MKINSVFTFETARWDSSLNNFVGRKSRDETREIEVAIIARDGKPLLVFTGGPTGFESYYLEDILEEPLRGDDFCICGGTVNSWPRCIVNWQDVVDLIHGNGYKFKGEK